MVGRHGFTGICLAGLCLLASCGASVRGTAPFPPRTASGAATLGPAPLPPTPEPPSPSPSGPRRTVQVFFPSVDRLVAEQDMVAAAHPLQGAIQALLHGPQAPRDHTQVPSGAQLLDLVVRQGIAYADFNRAFFGPGGPLGLELRLGQVVFTLTQFAQIQAVQFLVDGRIEAMTGNQGYPIGRPLSRKNFPYLSS